MRGLALSTAQYSLLRVEDTDPHPKNWRLVIRILCSQLIYTFDILDHSYWYC